MAKASDLLALQEIDQALDRSQARLAEIDVQLVESEELVSAREAVEERRKDVDELRSRLSDAETTVEDIRAKAAVEEGKLYGGKVTNPKELSDLDAELRSIKHLITDREDVLLALLVEIDEADQKLNVANSAYSEIEGSWKREQGDLLREKAEIEPEIASLQARREKQASRIDGSSMRLYQLLRDRHAGRAVAPLERGMCQGCRITLPMSLLQKARSGTGLVQCVSCERILLVS
jgi:predicted  nucleic acid-binding Zn-ribbon protein